MHIVVAVDGSPESRNALISALDNIEPIDGTVTAVHVIEPEPGGDQENEDPARDVLSRAKRLGKNRELTVETELLEGDTIEAITEYAAEHHVDAIYVGHRGLSGAGSELEGQGRGPLGSVARGIVERTPISVTVFDRGL